MYESFFGLRKRPFAALPDPACYVPIHGTAQALASLTQCSAEGRGIGVLTSPAGLGKTLICQRLARELADQFRVVLLPSGNFLTRRSLLQAILFELGHSFVRRGDQELRLELTSVLRRLSPECRGVILIVDEAHLLAPRMLEELRTLTHLAEAGDPMVRLVVSGQLALEESLSRPELDAFNQRVGAQAMLQPFTRNESIEYLGRRLAWVGVNITEIFTHDAVQFISEASDGSPRCLHQLCDHALLLSYLAEVKPVSIATVREALEDVKQLPLTWNEPISSRNPRAELPHIPAQQTPRVLNYKSPAAESKTPCTVETEFGVEHEEIEFETPKAISPHDDFAKNFMPPLKEESDYRSGASGVVRSESVEVGATLEFGDEIATCSPTRNSAPGRPTISAAPNSIAHAPRVPAEPIKPATTDIDEEVVVDRYAALDAAIGRLTRTVMTARAAIRRRDASSTPVAKQSVLPAKQNPKPTARFDVVLPDHESAIIAPEKSAISQPMTDDRKPAAPAERRSYEHLFSELRRRRRGA